MQRVFREDRLAHTFRLPAIVTLPFINHPSVYLPSSLLPTHDDITPCLSVRILALAVVLPIEFSASIIVMIPPNMRRDNISSTIPHYLLFFLTTYALHKHE